MNMGKLMAGFVVAGGLLGFVAGSGGGCGARAAFDCHEICNRYQECFSKDYDVGACRDRCRSKADNDAQYESKTAACAACVGNGSCVSEAFNCANECIGIVP